jgi:hypothetical protein
LYVDELVFTGNNPKMLRDFKQAMIKKFEMTDIGLITYYLGIKIKQAEYKIFVNQEKFAKRFSRSSRWKIVQK